MSEQTQRCLEALAECIERHERRIASLERDLATMRELAAERAREIEDLRRQLDAHHCRLPECERAIPTREVLDTAAVVLPPAIGAVRYVLETLAQNWWLSGYCSPACAEAHAAQVRTAGPEVAS